MMTFVPVFFFASEYAQVALGESASEASLTLLYFFAGFVVAAQIGGRMLDRGGAKTAGRPGCALGVRRACAVGGPVDDARHRAAGVVHRPGRCRHGPHARPGQHRRSQPRTEHVVRRGDGDHPDRAQLRGQSRAGRPRHDPRHRLPVAPGDVVPRPGCALGRRPSRGHDRVAPVRGTGGGHARRLPHFIQIDFASATQTVLYVMAGIMGVAALVALRGLPRNHSGRPPAEDVAVAAG